MKGNVIQAKPVIISKTLPFIPDEDDIIYVEGHHTIKVERWRIEYYQDFISNYLILPEGYRDGYFQLIVEMMRQPVFWEFFSDASRHALESEIIDSFDFQDFLPQESLEPAIYILDTKCEDGTYRFLEYRVGEYDLRKVLVHILQNLVKRDWDEGLEYEKSSGNPIKEPDLVAQLLDIVNGLHKEGLTDDDIVAIIKANQEDQYYMYVSSRYEISISRNNGGERVPVHMSPLDKAVYILYLKHPEGINFSYLPDYRDELMSIYMKLMDYRALPAMKDSVLRVTDPTDNSINEKCARISRSFRKILGNMKAEPFCITGKRGDIKKIGVDRKYVIWK